MLDRGTFDESVMKTVAELAASGAEALVVDDLRSAQKIVARFLKRIGFKKVYQCGSAEQAFRSVNNHHHIRVVVSDVLMPDETGQDLVRRLETLDLPEPLVIILTSVGSEEGLATGSYHGLPLEILLKPFSVDQLAERINSFLARLTTSPASLSDSFPPPQ